MSKTSILVVGGGGREHALVWALSRSPNAGAIFAAPGNAGTAALATNVPIQADDSEALVQFALQTGIDLTVVGPEAPLAAGLVDALQAVGLRAFGPTQAAAQLEASKAFAKDFMRARGIPTGRYATFSAYDDAVAYVQTLPTDEGVVVKASGLAAGKGVLMCANRAEALAALDEIMSVRAFGAAGNEVLIEERLSGPELSLLAFADGTTVVPMVPARDHKRVFDGDQGPNTGGMGVYAPPPDADAALVAQITRDVLVPTVRGMAAAGTPYVGVLYAGLMLTADGPRVLEFNCRFGDPETQVILPLLESDLLATMEACIDGRLAETGVHFRDAACAAVVAAAPGYPGPYPKGLTIEGVAAAEARGALVFHAGTARRDGQLVSAGGRVLAVSALGADLAAAVGGAYDGLAAIHFTGLHYRRDIGR
jgi:phosphoribosylamine--glycine ligase